MIDPSLRPPSTRAKQSDLTTTRTPENQETAKILAIPAVTETRATDILTATTSAADGPTSTEILATDTLTATEREPGSRKTRREERKIINIHLQSHESPSTSSKMLSIVKEK